MKKRNIKNKNHPARIKFYADENVDFARHFHKVNVKTAVELGYSGRDDHFHFCKAKRLGRFLLTSDRDFIEHIKFPLKQTYGIVILNGIKESLDLGYMSLWLTKYIVQSKKEIEGTKIVVYKDHLEIYSLDETGKVVKQRLP